MKEYILSKTEKVIINNFLSMLEVWEKEFRGDEDFTSAIDTYCIADDVRDFCRSRFENFEEENEND